MTNRLHVGIRVAAGGCVSATAVAADYLPGAAQGWSSAQLALFATGVLMASLGAVVRTGAFAGLLTRVSMSVLSVFALVALVESASRVAGIDFAHEERAWRRTPPFFRFPNVAEAPVFFRREGPETWNGQVLHTMLDQLGVRPNPYGDEAVVTVSYNALGFRNPDRLSDWDIAVAGDSFTELGYLPQEELFTSQLGKALGVSVLNLGVSYTGPLTQLSYLDHYGVSARTRLAMIVFFEGNDLNDLHAEAAALDQWQRTSRREYREFTRQTSFLVALRTLARPQRRGNLGNGPLITGYFGGREGEVPVTLVYTPPGGADLSSDTRDELERFFTDYETFGRTRSLHLWLAFMPAKERVLHGHVRFVDAAPAAVKAWQPTDLPAVMAEYSARHGVSFVDLTPFLVEETQRDGQMLYNGVYDTHLNARGAGVVARSLARVLTEGDGE